MSEMTLIHSRNKKIAVTGALSALTILLGIPGLHLGYIQTGTISFTIMHIPVVLAAALAGLPGAAVTSLIFGLTSLMNAAVSTGSVLDPLFVNPLCSVLPRLAFGLCAYGLVTAINMIPRCPRNITAAAAAFISSLAHTTAVIGSLYVFLRTQTLAAMGGQGFLVIMGIVLPGALLEATTAALTASAVVAAIVIESGRRSKLAAQQSSFGAGDKE